MIGDPLIASMQGYNGDKRLWTWFETFLYLEVLQLMVYVLGARGLVKGEILLSICRCVGSKLRDSQIPRVSTLSYSFMPPLSRQRSSRV